MMSPTSSPETAPPRTSTIQVSNPPRILLYAGFAATGVSLSIPGALMPWLLSHWALKDSQAGFLLFLFFLGGTSGAFLSRGSLNWSIARGGACTAIGAVWMSCALRETGYMAMLLYGLGLGITMTSISLLQSRRWATDCAAEMTRLNLLWAVGACSGPWLILHKGIMDDVYARHVLVAVGAAFAIFAVLVATFEKDAPAPKNELIRSKRRRGLPVPLSLLILTFCITGVESSTGGWLATYTHRGGHSLGVTIWAPTCFWAGLLASRLLHSISRVSRSATYFLLTWNLIAMAAGFVFLIGFHSSPLALAMAFVIGFTSGPMYPLLVALVLRHDSSSLVFILGGLGSAALPFLTGILSTSTGSLRTGLLIPGAAAVALVIAGHFAALNLRRVSSQNP